MSGKKVSLIVTATIVLLCAIASASAAPTFTLTVQKGKLGTNTTFLPGETIVVNASYANVTPYTGSLYLNVSNATWSTTLSSTTITSTSTGYSSGVGWLNCTWVAAGVAVGQNYTIGLYYNSSAPIKTANIVFAGISVTPTGTIQASNAVTFYVNVSAFKPVEAPVINLTAFGLGKVTTTYVTETRNSNGVPVYVYKATVNLSKATYTSKTFSVKVCYINNVSKSYTYSLKVIPNKPYQWVVLESTINKPSTFPNSDDSAVPASLYATTIDAKEYIAVADRYGNVLEKPGSHSATIAVISGPGSLSDSTVFVDNTTPYALVTVSVPVSDAPCNVTIQPFGSGLVATTKRIVYYPGIDHLSLTISKCALYANNSDTAKVYVALKDSKGDTIPLQHVIISISEATTLGLNFSDGTTPYLSTAVNSTNSSGIATFMIKAGRKPGTATVRAVISGYSGTWWFGTFPWNGKFGSVNVTLLPAPNKTNTVVYWPASIVAGVKTQITVTLKDYDNQPIKNCGMYPVKFNITSGDAKWLENNARCYEVTKTNANGNVTATLYTTNATNNKVTVVISVKNESGKWEVYANKTYTIKPNKVHEIAVFYNGNKVNSYAYPAEAGKAVSVQFTIKYLDEYGNVNKSSGTVKIVPQTSIVGSFSQTTVSMTNGVGYVSFTTNASAPVGASTTFIFNDTTYKTGNVTLTVVASGVKGVSVSANTSYPKVGQNVTIKAQLLGVDNTPLAKDNVTLYMTVLQPNGIYMAPMKNGTKNGVATFPLLGKIPGKYIVKVYNNTYDISNTTTVVFVGPPVKLILSANKTTVTNGSTVEFTVKAEDMYGMPSLPKNKYVDVLINGTLEKNITLNANATAVFNWTFDKVGTYSVYAMCLNNTTLLHDEVTINVVQPKTSANISITNIKVTPSTVEIGKLVTITIYAKNTGDLAGTKTVTVSVYNESGLVYTENVTISIAAHSSTAYNLTYVPEAAGNYTVVVNGITATFTATAPAWIAPYIGSNGKVTFTGVVKAIHDWMNNKLTMNQIVKIISYWLKGTKVM